MEREIIILKKDNTYKYIKENKINKYVSKNNVKYWLIPVYSNNNIIHYIYIDNKKFIYKINKCKLSYSLQLCMGGWSSTFDNIVFDENKFETISVIDFYNYLYNIINLIYNSDIINQPFSDDPFYIDFYNFKLSLEFNNSSKFSLDLNFEEYDDNNLISDFNSPQTLISILVKKIEKIYDFYFKDEDNIFAIKHLKFENNSYKFVKTINNDNLFYSAHLYLLNTIIIHSGKFFNNIKNIYDRINDEIYINIYEENEFIEYSESERNFYNLEQADDEGYLYTKINVKFSNYMDLFTFIQYINNIIIYIEILYYADISETIKWFIEPFYTNKIYSTENIKDLFNDFIYK